jgi:hypothetical protein
MSDSKNYSRQAGETRWRRTWPRHSITGSNNRSRDNNHGGRRTREITIRNLSIQMRCAPDAQVVRTTRGDFIAVVMMLLMAGRYIVVGLATSDRTRCNALCAGEHKSQRDQDAKKV